MILCPDVGHGFEVGRVIDQFPAAADAVSQPGLLSIDVDGETWAPKRPTSAGLPSFLDHLSELSANGNS